VLRKKEVKNMPNFYCGNCLVTSQRTRIKFTTLDELVEHIGEHLGQQKAGAKEPFAEISENPEALLHSIENPLH